MELIELYKLVRGSAGICTDTRSIRQGEIFFALKGPSHDGNRYATTAVMKGAVAAITDDKSLNGEKIIVVNDVLKTLTDLAVIHRKALTVPVIGITGTNGKTTTKELVTSVLSAKGRVHSTAGNLNNHIGVPLTLLSAPEDTIFLVVEMGANHRGEIESLCETARPTHGIITNIGKAHLEGFGSFDNLIATKTELYHWLKKEGGIAFFNERNPLLKELVFKILNKAVPYSGPSGTDIIVTTADKDDMFLNVAVDYQGQKHFFSTNLFGSYNLDNIRAAMAVGIFFGVPFDAIIAAISSYIPANNRSQVMKTDSNTLICDSYNANPSSMAKALASFSSLPAKKKMVILGDMLELGVDTVVEHKAIVESLDGFGEIEICLVGPNFGSVSNNKKINLFATSGELREWLKQTKLSGYTILVKGSRGMMLEKIYDVL